MDWLPWLDVAHSLHWLSQTPTPTPPPNPTATELELLRQQIDFLKEANASLDKNFERYVNMMQLSIGVAGGVILALGAALSVKNLNDFNSALRGINSKVREAVDQRIAVAIRSERQRLNRLEAVLDREDTPERITIDYVVPAQKSRQPKKELNILLKILENRGFGTFLKYESEFQDPNSTQHKSEFGADVVVLDLHHAGLDNNTDKDKAEAVIRAVGAKLRSTEPSALVVYGNGYFDAVTQLNRDDKYCGASNTPLTFVARVLEAAYVVDAVKRL
ncbi:MAG: hypothetical protein ACTS2F_07755 [Thainema sp.]